MKKALIERRNEQQEKMENIVNLAKAEGRALTAEEVTQFEACEAEIANIDKTLDAVDRMEKNRNMVPYSDDSKEVKDVKAFADYIRGIVNTDAPITKGDNGALVPATIANKIIDKVYVLSPIFERAEKFNMGGTLTIPYVDQSTTTLAVAYATEFTDVEAKAVKTKTVSLTGYVAMALAQVSNSLINNSQFDIVGFVTDKIALEFARFLDKELIKGTAEKISGLAGGVTQSVTTAAAAAITADELIALQDLIPDVYQANACWIMSPATRTAIRQLKADGKYLLNPDIREGFGWTLLGKPVFVTENMDDIAADKTTIYYGDMTGLAVKISEEMNVQVLREKYATAHALGVVASMEVDAKVQDTSKIAKLVQKAS